MTLYCATILGCCIVQLKKKKKKKKKKWQTRHQVPRCWPYSTVCRSPGHGIWSTWANGDIPMYIWADNRNTGRFLEPPFRSQEPFPLPETEVTSSKMAGGSGNGSWLLNGGSKNLPILLVYVVIEVLFLVMATFNHVGGSFHLVKCHQQRCAACWAHFRCHYELWPISECNPSPFSMALLEENTTHIFSQNYASSGCIPYILCYSIISHYVLLVGLLLQYGALFQSEN